MHGTVQTRLPHVRALWTCIARGVGVPARHAGAVAHTTEEAVRVREGTVMADGGVLVVDAEREAWATDEVEEYPPEL